MDDQNQKTIDAYNAHVQEYIDGTPQLLDGDVKAWINKALTFVKKGGTVLEIGSAFGRDAEYMETMGYKVHRTDATQSFVDLLKRQGHEAQLLNAITDDFGGLYAMVFANAVLLHFTPDETSKVLAKAHSSLDTEGVLAFTVKQGDGEEWTEAKLNAPRYFCYWQADDLRKIVSDTGFEIEDLSQGTTKNAQWLQVIAKKVVK